MLEYLIAHRLSLSHAAFGAEPPQLRPGRPGTRGDPSSPQMTLPERYRAIRASLDRGHGPAQPPAAMAEARTRLSVALASLPSGERRRFARWPFVRPCLLIRDGVGIPASTLDIGIGGVMLAPLPGLAPGDVVAATLELTPGHRCGAVVSIDRDGIGHLALDGSSETVTAKLEGWLQNCAVSYEAAFWEAAALANDVQTILERALHAEAISTPELFPAIAYGPRALALFDGALDPLLAATIPADDRLAYVRAVDRQGYVAAEWQTDHANPDLPSRRGRHFRDAVTLRAARFAAGPVVQTARRLPGREPAGVVSDVSAPVFVRGRRWGCVQIGRNLVSSSED